MRPFPSQHATKPTHHTRSPAARGTQHGSALIWRRKAVHAIQQRVALPPPPPAALGDVQPHALPREKDHARGASKAGTGRRARERAAGGLGGERRRRRPASRLCLGAQLHVRAPGGARLGSGGAAHCRGSEKQPAGDGSAGRGIRGDDASHARSSIHSVASVFGRKLHPRC